MSAVSFILPFITACAIVAAALPLSAQDMSPVGRWRTVDDKTGQTKSIVEITDVNGELRGTVVKVFAPPAPSDNPLCKKCPEPRKDKPVVGMEILWGLKRDGSEYTGGRVLDPEEGKIYRGKVRLLEAGKKLELRGYIGVSLFGRSQTWVRE